MASALFGASPGLPACGDVDHSGGEVVHLLAQQCPVLPLVVPLFRFRALVGGKAPPSASCSRASALQPLVRTAAVGVELRHRFSTSPPLAPERRVDICSVRSATCASSLTFSSMALPSWPLRSFSTEGVALQALAELREFLLARRSSVSSGRRWWEHPLDLLFEIRALLLLGFRLSRTARSSRSRSCTRLSASLRGCAGPRRRCSAARPRFRAPPTRSGDCWRRSWRRHRGARASPAPAPAVRGPSPLGELLGRLCSWSSRWRSSVRSSALLASSSDMVRFFSARSLASCLSSRARGRSPRSARPPSRGTP